jgi:NADPH-dependent 2,4-dienoyl-CoA reductase/sulfur reductase-like enzyme
MSSRGSGGMGGPFGGGGNKRLATAAEIQDWIEDIANDALEYRGLGFDVVEVTPIGDLGAANTRTDQYGGSLENRCRATTELLAKIRELCGPHFLISMQVTAEFDPQWVEMLKLWDTYVDIYHVRPPRNYGEHPSTYIFPEEAPPALEGTAKLKAAGVDAVIGAACGFQNPDVIEKAIEDGKCDMVFMARTFNCDPDYLEKVIEQRAEDITPCLRCDACHSAICAVNPIFGLENVYKDMFKPSKGGKKVAVIGGGPAGLRAAMVAAQRGHQVTVFERSNVLGGQAIHADYVYGKWGMQRFKNWEILQCQKLGVEIKLNTEATPELIEAGNYNAVIAATGAAPIRLDIPGGAEAPHPTEVFGKEETLGHKVVIVGGSMTGMDCAMYLRDTGHEVTVITRSTMGRDIDGHDAPQTLQYLKKKYADVKEIDHAQILSVEGGKAVYRKEDGTTAEEPFDSVVISGGMRPCVQEAETFFGTAPEFYVVGDAQISRAHGMQSQMLLNKPDEFLKGNMRFANYSAFMAANNI